MTAPTFRPPAQGEVVDLATGPAYVVGGKLEFARESRWAEDRAVAVKWVEVLPLDAHLTPGTAPTRLSGEEFDAARRPARSAEAGALEAFMAARPAPAPEVARSRRSTAKPRPPRIAPSAATKLAVGSVARVMHRGALDAVEPVVVIGRSTRAGLWHVQGLDSGAVDTLEASKLVVRGSWADEATVVEEVAA